MSIFQDFLFDFSTSSITDGEDDYIILFLRRVFAPEKRAEMTFPDQSSFCGRSAAWRQVATHIIH